MKHNIRNFVGLLGGIVLACGVANAASTVRGVSNAAATRTNAATTNARSGAVTVARTTTARDMSAGASGRVSARGAIVSRALRNNVNEVRAANNRTARSATNTVRGATVQPNTARTATPASSVRNTSLARATAVFNDISKIGGGYAACRDAYATCMDQFCANANDTYRRCFCSSRFTDFRDTENALDQAKTLLMQFEDNNLNAVDKSAAEVNAMYTATIGESAIKNDTSGAAKILDQIGDLLSGKTKATKSNNSASLGSYSIDVSTSIDDIWGDNSDSNIFASRNGTKSLSELEGVDLYNASNDQCLLIIADSCQSDAVLQMARSSYSIMITQDCNAYEKKIDSQREAVKQTVRTAEKYLREARLDEYRNHNSADVNECMGRVKTAILADTACGADYKRCLDYTGAYVSQTTGEPIYSQRLFQLNDLIKLAGADSNIDVLKQNQQFDKFLDSKRMYAATALDTCRDIADTVWTEFKRTALIEIAQAQDEKIESVKMSCVSTMAECYDTQSSALKEMDNTTAKSSGAVSAYAARQMCTDKVNACASLFGGTEGCKFDGNGKLTNTERCGISALLNFVDTVDTTRINEGCESALRNYAKKMCTPESGTDGYPWNCRLMVKDTLSQNISAMSSTYCNLGTNATIDNTNNTKIIVNNLVREIEDDLVDQMNARCTALGGVWVDATDMTKANDTNYTDLKAYESAVYNGNTNYIKYGKTRGYCKESTARIYCDAYNTDDDSGTPLATYNATTMTCQLSTKWYETKCTDELGGIWENSTCYISK